MSATPSIQELLQARLTRRQVLQGGLAAALASSLPLAGCASMQEGAAVLGFSSITPSSEDTVRIAPGYRASVLWRWGDAIGSPEGMPAFKMDASNSAAEQALQCGMHNDGMQFFPLPHGSGNSSHGLLVMNHEYIDDGLLHTDGLKTWSAEKVRKSQCAVGVSVIEVVFRDGRWDIVRPSRYARRITALTPMAISGPAAGTELMRTALDPSGREVLGTFAGCAHGYTPWGTYLTCEENWNFMFTCDKPNPHQARYGVTTKTSRYRWSEFDERFSADRHPNEPNRFGWVVEIDPTDPDSKPVKRTAMGRIKHEGAYPSIGRDRRIAFYMGDDEAFEYIYKFVTRDPWNPSDRAANRDLLDQGTLYVARFDAGGTGRWLPLVFGSGELTPANGFSSQAEVLVKTRQAADILGATKMDRPEWAAVHPVTRDVYCTLTNNAARGSAGRAAADAANPRANNTFGHIIRWREEGGDVGATRFTWDIFAMGGNPELADPSKKGSFKGDAFGSPDGLWFDSRGILWVCTDVSPTALNRGDYAALGNNQILAVDPRDGSFRRFLTGPRGCEITGLTGTPDGRTFFVNIQHPGEIGGERTDPDQPRRLSNWPDFDPNGRPRSATLVIRRDDGGMIGV